MVRDTRFGRRQFVKTTGLSAVGLAGLAGCVGGGGSDGGGGSSTVNVGVLGPRSGPLSQLWPFYFENAKLARDQINGDGNFVHDGGGLDVGGESVTLDIQEYDTEAEPNVGVSAAERLIEQDGVPVILGCISSTVTLSVMEVTGDAGVPQITSVSTSPKITNPPDWHEWMFRNKDTAAMRASWITDGIVSEIEPATVGMIGPNDDFGVDQMNTYEEYLAEDGVEVTSKVAFNPDQQSFNTELQQIHSEDPDLLYLAINDPAMGETLVPQARQVGFETIMAPAPLSSPNIPDQIGDPLEGVYVEVPFPENPQGIEHINQWVNALDSATEGEVPPDYIGAPTYDAINVIADSIVRAGSTDPADIRDAMTEASMTGVYGYPDFTLEFGEHNQAQVQSGIGRWQGGDLEILTGPFADG